MAIFVDSNTQRFTLNYFNRRALGGVNNLTANRTTGSTTYVEINTEIRCEFLTWADEVVIVQANSLSLNDGAGNINNTAIGFDGTNQENAIGNVQTYAANAQMNSMPMIAKAALAEGYHFATLLGAVDAGTATFYGATYTADTTRRKICSLTVLVRG